MPKYWGKLYQRSQVHKQLLRSQSVTDAIKSIEQQSGRPHRLVQKEAESYLREISANMDFSVLEGFSVTLRALWKRVFDRVDVRHFDYVLQLEKKGYEIVYVPNHRSHLDYLLLLYLVKEHGLLPPLTAAGKNLDFFLVGQVLRRGCAFFIRRKFQGNILYSEVLKSYLGYLIDNKIPMAFFPEGGRSRSGKLLKPRSGFLSMIAEHVYRGTPSKVALVPVYIGYDKVLENHSFVKEMGRGKKQETIFRFLKAVPRLGQTLGNAYVGVAKPILLNEKVAAFKASHPNLGPILNEQPQYRRFIDSLSMELIESIADAAVVSETSLLAAGVGTIDDQGVDFDRWMKRVDQLKKLLLKASNYSHVTLPKGFARDYLRHGTRVLRIRGSQDGMISSQCFDKAVVTYGRNMVSHLFAIESLLATVLQKAPSATVGDVLEHCRSLYPQLKEEWHLPWDNQQLPKVIHGSMESLKQLGLLTVDDDKVKLTGDDPHQLLPLLSFLVPTPVT